MQFEELSYFKPLVRYGFLRHALPRCSGFYKFYPLVASALGKFFKKNTELLFVCAK